MIAETFVAYNTAITTKFRLFYTLNYSNPQLKELSLCYAIVAFAADPIILGWNSIL